MKKKLSTDQQDNKDIIFDLLEAKGVKSFTVTFDGSGDSGQIDEITLDEKLQSLPVEGASVNRGTVFTEDGPTKKIEYNPPLREVIEELCYDTLEGVCGGWEINEGSYGEFVFDVKKRNIHLDFNERIEEVNSSEYDF